ncbi:MAG: hypothetical protein AABZ39_12640 [Spirochaetota bacterium]
MRIIAIILITATLTFPADVVWQLGVSDGTSTEFVPYSSKEFIYSREFTNLPGYDALKHQFTYTAALGENGRPKFPAGISSPGAANPTWANRQFITWDDDGEGTRVFEIKIINSGVLVIGPGPLNENLDPDTLVQYSLRISLPSEQLFHQYLPNDLKNPVTVRASFTPRKGKNVIELLENSGKTYRRCYHYDYLKVMRENDAARNVPVLELAPARGFLHSTAYDRDKPAFLSLHVFNLVPRADAAVAVRFLDFFDTVIAERTVTGTANENGRMQLETPMPSVAGSVRAFASLSIGGTAQKIQMGKTNVMLRAAAVRTIAPMSEEEKDMQFLGMSSLEPTIFDPYDDRSYFEHDINDYRAWRRILGTFHERLHSLRWAHLEKNKGEYRWDFWDKLIDGEHRDGVRLQVTLLTIPEWHAKELYPDRKYIWDGTYSKPDMNEWRRLCTDVTTRYKGKISEIEVWNEPSEFSKFWYKADASDYFDLIKNASETVRAVDPRIAIVAETVWARQLDFSQKLYALGVGKYIDHPADHYWTDERLESVNLFLASVGTNRGLYANETKSGIRDNVGEVTEDLRKKSARMMLRNLIYGNANGIARTYEFMMRSLAERIYGLVNPDNTPKYLFSVMKTAVNRTAGARFEKRIALAANVDSFLYRYMNPVRIRENHGETALFIFNRAGTKPMSIYCGKDSVTLVDIMDNERIAATKGGVLTFTLDENPVIVLGADSRALLAQDDIAVNPPQIDALPDGTIEADIRITGTSPVTLIVESGLGPPIRTSLTPTGTLSSYRLRIPLNNAPEGDHIIRIRAERTPMIMLREIPVAVNKRPIGENILNADTLSESAKAWTSWGKGTLTRGVLRGMTTAKKEFVNSDTGGISIASPIAVQPSRSYLVSARLRGEGEFSTHFNTMFADGKRSPKDTGFFRAKLKPYWTPFSRKVNTAMNVSGMELNFLMFKTAGHFELGDVSVMRIDPLMPVNRILYRMNAKEGAAITADGDIGEWNAADFITVNDENAVAEDDWRDGDCSFSMAAAWKSGGIVLAITVTDDTDTPSTADETLADGDSVEIGMAPSIDISGSFRIAVGRKNGSTAVYRKSIIPSPDIVPSYRIGEAPEGITAAVVRSGSTTTYEIKNASPAIFPMFATAREKEIGFAVLVNDIDGDRKSRLGWAGGLSDNGGAYHFGTLKLQ